MSSAGVPAWPIITLRWEGEILLVSDSDASLDMRRVLPIPGEDPFETARRAAVKACKSLHMDRARVEGIDGDEVLSLIVDSRQESLIPAHSPTGSVLATNRAHTALGGMRSQAKRSRFSKILVPLVKVVAAGATITDQAGERASKGRSWAKTRKGRRALTAVVVIACVVATGGVVGAQRAGLLAPTAQAVQTPAVAPAGQLPVYSPAGWGTFASWTVPASEMNVDPVLSPNGKQVITITSGQLNGLDAGTGALLWSTTLEGSVSSLRVMGVDGEQKIIVADGAKVKVFALDGTPGAVLVAGDVTAQAVTDIGREVFFTLPDQRAMVFTDGGLALRRIPAGAVALGVDKGTLLAVEISSARLWRITGDGVKFPAPLTIEKPKGGTKLTAVYTAGDGSLVTVWAGVAKTDTAIVAVQPVFPELAAPTVIKTVPASSTTTSAAVTDRYSSTVLVNRILIDTSKHTAIEVPSSSGKLGAGYWWGTKEREAVRVDTAGDAVDSPADAPVPLFALPSHRVLVKAGKDQSIYALAPEGEKK